MRRTAVITGAYGYLGSRVRARLDDAGWTTAALVRSPRDGDHAAAWSLGERPPETALAGADALVHCAWDFGARGRSEVWRTNVEGSALLLREADRLGVPRLLVLSSMSAYAGTRQLYGRAKLAVEDIVIGLGGIAVRPGIVYGPEPGGMAGTLEKLTRMPVVPIFGGSARQFPVHEDDLTRAIVDILERAEWQPEAFGIAQLDAVSFRDLLGALAGRDGRRCRFVRVPWRMVHVSLRAVELAGAGALLPLRSDSVLGLVRPAPFVPPSVAFPGLCESLRRLQQTEPPA